MAEIALQFHLYTINQPEDWSKMLPHIQFLINNIKFMSITKTLNKIALGFTLNQLLDLLADSIRLDHKVTQVKGKNAISFAQINFNHYYNWLHQPMNFRVNNFALLWLYKRYLIL